MSAIPFRPVSSFAPLLLPGHRLFQVTQVSCIHDGYYAGRLMEDKLEQIMAWLCRRSASEADIRIR
jgi:hypothetical protein